VAEVLLNTRSSVPTVPVGATDAQRVWAPLVDKVVTLLGGYAQLQNPASRPIWVDVGCGDGTLVMTASDYGFASVGLDIRAEAVTRIQGLGFNAVHQDFMKVPFEIVPNVLSMMGVLEQIPYPLQALRKAAQVLHPGGVLVLSTPDLASSSWKSMDLANANPHWTELENCHTFTRERLIALLRDSGFELAHFTLAGSSKAQMELYAVRSPTPATSAHS
jgi:SAM-dependent methyltransferase